MLEALRTIIISQSLCLNYMEHMKHTQCIKADEGKIGRVLWRFS